MSTGSGRRRRRRAVSSGRWRHCESPPQPIGWSSFQGWALLKRGASPPAGAGITFDRPLALYTDRCRWDDTDGLVEIGPTVDDLVDAFVDLPEYQATNVTDIVVDGFAGKPFDMLGVADDFDLAECSQGGHPYGTQEHHFHRPWAGRHWMGPTEMSHVRVLDVEGERVVVRGLYFSGTSDEDVAELFDMLDAIRIEVEAARARWGVGASRSLSGWCETVPAVNTSSMASGSRRLTSSHLRSPAFLRLRSAARTGRPTHIGAQREYRAATYREP